MSILHPTSLIVTTPVEEKAPLCKIIIIYFGQGDTSGKKDNGWPDLSPRVFPRRKRRGILQHLIGCVTYQQTISYLSNDGFSHAPARGTRMDKVSTLAFIAWIPFRRVCSKQSAVLNGFLSSFFFFFLTGNSALSVRSIA